MGVDPPIDITTGQRKTILTLLERHLPGTAAWVYGSRAKWTSRPESDLDLVVFSAPGQGRQVGNLREAFDESDLPFRVDLFIWDEVPESFRKQIEAEHVVLAEEDEPELGKEWCELVLGELTDNFDSLRIPVKKADRRLGLYPYYGASGIVDHVDDFIFDGEYLLVAEDGENLRTRKTPIAFLADGKFWVNNHAHILRGNRKADTRYLMYALSELDISGYLTGSTMPKLTRNNLDRISLYAPPPEEQRVIAYILGTLDDKIELNRRMNETLEAMARALFKSWFVDFAPVRAKMEGRDPGLPRHLADLFPDQLVDSEMGEIPEGWAVDPIDNFADVVYGAPFASKQFNTDNLGVPLIRIRDLTTHAPGVSTQQVHKKGHLIEPGDIVVGMDGEFRLHLWKGPKSWLNQRVCHFEPKAVVPTAFLVEALRKPLAFFERGKVGTTVIHLGKSDIDTFRIIQPGDPLLSAFADIAQPLLDQTVVNALDSRTISQTRNLLRPKLISGEIRVPNDVKMEAAS